MRRLLASAALLALVACGSPDTSGDEAAAEADRTANATTQNLADAMASDDDGESTDKSLDIPDSEDRPVMQLQVVLDRLGFGPGVIDGKTGMSTENALRGFQEANDLEITGENDEATTKALAQWDRIPATRIVTIPDNWGSLSFEEIPDDPAKQAEMEGMGYETLDEKLAERFHTTLEVLRQLNPGGRPAGISDGNSEGNSATPNPSSKSSSAGEAAESDPPPTKRPGDSYFQAGQQIRVPNIGADKITKGAVSDDGWRSTLASLGVGSDQPDVSKIVVSKSAGTLKAYDMGGKLVALFTVTTGSSHDPLPLGEWGITGVAHNPPFAYNPELFWDVSDDEEKQQLPPGPNGPVGVVWIDLTKEHYGIHGTPEPQTIGRTQSHGCVRLTNWDAARLAEMVSGSTKVIFEA
ncbi:hypothetical protein AMC99_00990 [Altererythrobacter epoxidivorans]|uniref:L,D-TPase catalytic domain-containing protein n=2 Tax=Altererythrobacter epoxidivorans TaxID=361183 RepID=A0A0M4M771_9SPHN|nr:L,D-transpeptidase family protein [Altererythrobacter epoxidivorans]ALE16289.1 hypothetical protein AMC99_00990 [Altererythrobacter epoxidivorans]